MSRLENTPDQQRPLSGEHPICTVGRSGFLHLGVHWQTTRLFAFSYGYKGLLHATLFILPKSIVRSCETVTVDFPLVVCVSFTMSLRSVRPLAFRLTEHGYVSCFLTAHKSSFHFMLRSTEHLFLMYVLSASVAKVIHIAPILNGVAESGGTVTFFPIITRSLNVSGSWHNLRPLQSTIYPPRKLGPHVTHLQPLCEGVTTTPPAAVLQTGISVASAGLTATKHKPNIKHANLIVSLQN